jgi:hypothetical protein
LGCLSNVRRPDKGRAVNWFSVRSVYLHGEEPNGTPVYEERTLLFRADTPEKAFEMADAESSRYLELNPTFRRVGQPGTFMLSEKGDDLHGAEVWSLLEASSLPPDEFFRTHYTDIEVQTEDE